MITNNQKVPWYVLMTIQGWAKVGLVVRMENSTIINNTKINSIPYTHDCKPTFANPCTFRPTAFTLTLQFCYTGHYMLFRTDYFLLNR